jgi:eukaryotic-like serine/threonine-protein kinase
LERVVALGRGKTGAEDLLADEQAFALAYSGHLRQARSLSRRAADTAKQAQQTERAALFEARAAMREAFLGNVPEARTSAASALELSKGKNVQYAAAFALALSGDAASASPIAQKLESRFPEDTTVRYSYLPELRALFALNHGEPAKAIEVLEAAAPYEMGAPSGAIGMGTLYPIYVRGVAYLALNRGADAVAEFEKILNHRGIVRSDPVGAVARLQLARAFHSSGEKTKEKAAYEDFLTLWKDADTDIPIPILKQAQTEYAKLQ